MYIFTPNTLIESSKINANFSQVTGGSLSKTYFAKGAHGDATSSATFVDQPGMTKTIDVTAGSLIEINVLGTMRHFNGAGNFTYWTLLRDGVVIANDSDSGQGSGLTITSVSSYSPIVIQAYVENETAGSHTYKLQWRVDAGSCDCYGPSIMKITEHKTVVA